MNTKTLSSPALSVTDQYINFKFSNAICSIPYYNNKIARARAGLRAYIGKGSPKDIFEEVEALTIKNHIVPETLTNESLKKLLVDNSIGIECSGFAYYVLNSESENRRKGQLDKHISFINCRGLIGKLRCSLRPIENCNVSTFSSDKNSEIISLKKAMPGDIVTMIDDNEETERDHILVIHQIEYQNFIPYKLHYSHAVAYPEDGIYGSSIRQGTILISNIESPITSQIWEENSKNGVNNRLYKRAIKSKTEIRRLKWF